MAHEETVDPLEIAARLFAAIEGGRIDEVRDLYAPEVVVWHNHDEVEQDREANLTTLSWVIANVAGFRYTDVRRHATSDGFVQQHVARGTNRAGREVAMPACIVVRLEAGRIARLEEYLDASQARRFTER